MTRKFERLLFDGVPEQPEPIWERNDNSNVFMRHTGKPQILANNASNEYSVIIGTFTFDHEKLNEFYVSNVEQLKINSEDTP